MCTVSRSKRVILIVFILCFTFTVTTPFEWVVKPYTDESNKTTLRLDYSWVSSLDKITLVYGWVNSIKKSLDYYSWVSSPVNIVLDNSWVNSIASIALIYTYGL